MRSVGRTALQGDALSDKRKRDLFDTPGEMGLQRRRWFFLCYQYQGDPYATFAKVFGSRNAPSETSASGSGRGLLPKNPPVEHVLLITLEDIATGCIKILEISQQRISSSGQAIQHTKMLNVDSSGLEGGYQDHLPRRGRRSAQLPRNNFSIGAIML